MPQAVDHIALLLEQLSDQVHNLERRVAALEGQPGSAPSAAPQPASLHLERPRPPATWRGFPPVEAPSGFVPIFGKAVLGIAGAYLLRALAESPSIPKLPVLFIAILYACGWMIWAVRIHTSSPLASAVYAVTSALILSPMLWESTVRFRVLSPSLAAAVTVGFVALAIALAWSHDLQLIPWISTLTSVILALALIIETHELVPLTVALLTVALITEAAACLGHRLTLRAITALAADFAVWLLVFLLASAESVPEGYHPASPGAIALLCSLLLAIYGASIGLRCFILLQSITVFEIAQAGVAFMLASYGVMRATHGTIAIALGGFCLALSAICYWGALSRFSGPGYPRNRRVCATWAAALMLAGSFLTFPAALQIAFLSFTATAAALLYTKTRKLSLGMHASLYVTAAAAVSPVPNYTAAALAGGVPAATDWRFWLVSVAAGACYLIGSGVAAEQNRRRLLWVVPSAITGFTGAALAVAAIAHFVAPRAEIAPSLLSVIRTVVICAVALALAILGSRFRRAELGWLAYAAVALGTLKLLVEDLRFGNAASLVVSLLFYGLILIFLPRIMRRQSPQS